MKNNKNEFVKPGGLDLKDRLVSIQRVTKVTKGGRTFGFSSSVTIILKKPSVSRIAMARGTKACL